MYNQFERSMRACYEKLGPDRAYTIWKGFLQRNAIAFGNEEYKRIEEMNEKFKEEYNGQNKN